MKIKMTPKNIIMLVLTALFLIIFIQNIQIVTLRVLFWKVEMSRIIFIPLVMVIGFVLGFFVGKGALRKRSKKETQDEVKPEIKEAQENTSNS